jgi:predicted transcriptional regulator
MSHNDSKCNQHVQHIKSPLARHVVASLGEREREVLEVVWSEGSATVQRVAECLKTTLAYTTVMTTLDRLYKKRVLAREKRNRAFVYSPAVSPRDWERDRASLMVHGFFSGSAMNRDVLLSCLVDAVKTYDRDLLHRLEEKVRIAKQQSTRGGKPQDEGER